MLTAAERSLDMNIAHALSVLTSREEEEYPICSPDGSGVSWNRRRKERGKGAGLPGGSSTPGVCPGTATGCVLRIVTKC